MIDILFTFVDSLHKKSLIWTRR